MWTYSLIAQAVGWLVLITSSPLIYKFTYKVVQYFVYKLLPRDTIIQYKNNDRIVEAYYVHHSFFGKSHFRKLSDDELRLLGVNH